MLPMMRDIPPNIPTERLIWIPSISASSGIEKKLGCYNKYKYTVIFTKKKISKKRHKSVVLNKLL